VQGISSVTTNASKARKLNITAKPTRFVVDRIFAFSQQQIGEENRDIVALSLRTEETSTHTLSYQHIEQLR